MTNFISTSTDGDKGASDAFSRITKAQWQDYKTRFMPYESKLVSMFNNKGELASLENEGRQSVTDAFSSVGNDLAANRARYGVGLDTATQAAEMRRINVQRAAGLADVTNQVRLHVKDRDEAMLTGGLGELRDVKQQAGAV